MCLLFFFSSFSFQVPPIELHGVAWGCGEARQKGTARKGRWARAGQCKARQGQAGGKNKCGVFLTGRCGGREGRKEGKGAVKGAVLGKGKGLCCSPALPSPCLFPLISRGGEGDRGPMQCAP